MSLETIVRMLDTQVNFKESEIIHTFCSNDQTPVLSVNYHFDTEMFLLTYIETQRTEKYTTIDKLADTIDRFLNPQPLGV
ncbi:hypothetical protein HP456_20515 [Bacillus haikouensis]|uniref:hypothetical protein n=1 Tax=Bacillus haikouensis TaxID=1510468 RepID=UPI001553B60B|nr:hypothetical protein [Bacillus haikouensis]NQD68295.1 hypothetical protein [Bacillus haikouensis]